jgi:hypothetical protein
MAIRSLIIALGLLFVGCSISSEEEPSAPPVTDEAEPAQPSKPAAPVSTLNGCSAHSACLSPFNGVGVNCTTSQSGASCAGYSDRAVCGSTVVYCTYPPPPCGTCNPDTECCRLVNGCYVPGRGFCV